MQNAKIFGLKKNSTKVPKKCNAKQRLSNCALAKSTKCIMCCDIADHNDKLLLVQNRVNLQGVVLSIRIEIQNFSKNTDHTFSI